MLGRSWTPRVDHWQIHVGADSREIGSIQRPLIVRTKLQVRSFRCRRQAQISPGQIDLGMSRHHISTRIGAADQQILFKRSRAWRLSTGKPANAFTTLSEHGSMLVLRFGRCGCPYISLPHPSANEG